MSEDSPQAKAIIRILVYIERAYGPEDNGTYDRPGIRFVEKGYFCDAVVELEWRVGKKRECKLLQCYADELFPTLEEALQFVLTETGVELELLPEPETPFVPFSGHAYEPVAFYVKEFLPTDAPREAVEADSGNPPRNSDLTRRMKTQKRLVDMKNPDD